MSELVIVSAYLLAVISANLAVAKFGPSATVVSAFLFIALDMTSRDTLHDRWRGRQFPLRMGALILAGSILSWLLNRDAAPIAIASSVAFGASGVADTLTYWFLGDNARYVKVNGSNVVSALVDSLVFPALAFGFPLLWGIVLGQFVAKTVGGAMWYVILARLGVFPDSSRQDRVLT